MCALVITVRSLLGTSLSSGVALAFLVDRKIQRARPRLADLLDAVGRNPAPNRGTYPKGAGKESNWLGTVEGDGLFNIFRFYGPKKAIVEKTWKLPDFEKIR